MRIVGHRGTRLQAPENSLQALLSAYTAGADVLEFDLQLTRDDRLVVCHDGTIDRLTGESGRILEMTLDELRHTAGRYDFSATFNPFEESFRYYKPGRRLQLQIFEQLIDVLPRGVPLLIELKHESARDPDTGAKFADAVLEVLEPRNLLDKVVLYSKDEAIVRKLRRDAPATRVALLGDWDLPPAAQLERAIGVGAHGLVTALGAVVSPTGTLTPFVSDLAQAHASGVLSVGAVLYPYRTPGTFTEAEFRALADKPFVWSISTDTMFGAEVDGMWVDVASLAGSPNARLLESFGGSTRDRDRFQFGYAKANRFCEVTQQDGVRIQIDPYQDDAHPIPAPSDCDALARRVEYLEERLWYAERNWPFYSGGGFGLSEPVIGDFIAEVDYSVERPMTQAVTLEMAAVNVDPGRHVTGRPSSFRDKDSFYDPHGCPPYVGVEHDEDDGYRINWNLGTEYDSNQYGAPVGDGARAQEGRLRLERRGSFFSAYYRNGTDAPQWICVGSVRNDSLNGTVFLRCVAKRWRQEDERGGYYPIPSNTIVFRNFSLVFWKRHA